MATNCGSVRDAMSEFDKLGEFDLILADPPWDYHDNGHSRRIDRQYSIISLDIICTLPVATLAQPDCVLFLWSTAPLLPDGLQVLKAWGFEYRSNLVWGQGKHPANPLAAKWRLMSGYFWRRRSPTVKAL